MRNKDNQPKMTFRQKVARVYGRGSDEAATVNPSIEVDRHFTIKFSEQESAELDKEQTRIRDRLASGMRR